MDFSLAHACAMLALWPSEEGVVEAATALLRAIASGGAARRVLPPMRLRLALVPRMRAAAAAAQGQVQAQALELEAQALQA